MTRQDRLTEILLKEPRPSRRRLYFAALLGREVANVKAPPIIVGGSAIELYSQGSYVSGDIDLVGPRKELIAVLERWGFRRDGRLWHRADLEIAVDLVGSDYTGDIQRTREIYTPFGPVLVAAVEDLLVKRLASAKHWRIPNDIEQALLLAVAYDRELDWNYVEELSGRYHVADLLGSLRARLPPKARAVEDSVSD